MTFGLPFSFESEVKLKTLKTRCQKRALWKVIRSRRKDKPPVVIRQNKSELTAQVLKPWGWFMTKPVFYATIVDAEPFPQIVGKFLYQKVVRVVFWLGIIGISVYELIWINRVVQAYLNGISIDQWIGFSLALVPGPIFLLFALLVLNFFIHKNAHDVERIVDELKKIASANP